MCSGVAALTVSVIVPWRESDEHRARAWLYVSDHLASYGWEIIQGVHDEGAWCKAEAIRDGLQRATGDVLVVHDADVVIQGARPLLRAVEAVEQGAPWAIPHVLVHRLNERSTAHLYTHGTPDPGEPEEKGCPYVGVEGGGVVVLARDTYEQVPMDGRYMSWNLEDVSWGMALKVLAGPPVRLDNPLLHLWHPPQDRLTRNTPRDPAAWDLASRYRSAYRRWEREPRSGEGVAMMQALIDEAKAAALPHPAGSGCGSGAGPSLP